MHMINLHAATSLAKDLGLDLVDIYGISELWKRHEKTDEAYDKAVEKREKAGDALGQSYEREGIGNHELHELKWKEYHKACKEKIEARIEHDINREILLEQCRKQSPKIVDIFIAVCPINKFGKHLLHNRTWYTWCRDELWKRHKEAEQVYGRAADEDKKAGKAYWQTFEGDRKNVNKAYEECEKAHDKKYTTFKKMVTIEQAILRCSFVTRKSNWGEYYWMMHNFELFKKDDKDDKYIIIS
ncbi:hypothetical protein GLOIN_2v1779779 [Rhizophagus irregularis DAOM 181602=DAOM 197198]|nr:hypothetical protein GLOIN_2v1779779 [Rhizophagus irregularis DAOM 181602=DAOM 197198]